MKNSGREVLESVYKVEKFAFSENTTYGLGGYAKCAYFPENLAQLEAVYDYLTVTGEKFVVLGCGSNVLCADGGFDGCVISTKRLNKIQDSGDTLYCGGGVTVNGLLKFCLNNGLGGYEYLAGIPATVGGLALMNGGVPQRHIGDDIINVDFYDGKVTKFSNKNCNFGNKHSTMRDINGIIFGLNLSKYAVSREASLEKERFYLNQRKIQPHGKSCGCVFKNTAFASSGKLIDECGLKGFKIGSAHVSREHANFIINDGKSAADVYKLICAVKSKVFEKSGVLLEEEVVYIGEFDETYS